LPEEGHEAADAPEETAPADFRFGAIAVRAGMVAPGDLASALADQEARRSRGGEAPRIGELLRERGVLSEDEVRRILRVQLQRLPAEGHLLFGQIALARRFLGREALERALDEQSREILAGGEVRRIGRVLREAGAIGKEATAAILAYQARADAVQMTPVRRGSTELAEVRTAGRAESGPAGGGGTREAEARPAFLPRGAAGFVSDHSIWIVAAAGAVAALALVLLRETIFG
jgi:hypothetical protein